MISLQKQAPAANYTFFTYCVYKSQIFGIEVLLYLRSGKQNGSSKIE